MDPKLYPIIHGVLAPGAAAAAVSAVLLRPWNRERPRTTGLAGALAVGGGVAACTLVSTGWPGWLPPQVDKYVIHLAAAGAVIGLTRSWWSRPAALRATVTVLASAAVAYWLTRYKWNAAWSAGEGAAWLAGMALSGGLAWLVLEMLADRARGAWLPLYLWAAAAGLGLSLVLGAGEASKAEIAGAAASACAVLAIWGWWRPGWALAATMVAPAALVMHALIFMTAPKSSDPLPLPAASLLIVAAPAGGLARELLARARMPAWAATLLGLLVTGGVAGAAVKIAAAAFIPFE